MLRISRRNLLITLRNPNNLNVGPVQTLLLEPFDVSPQDRAVARAMIDLNTWEALRSAGLDAPSAVTAASRMLAAVSSSNAGATPP